MSAANIGGWYNESGPPKKPNGPSEMVGQRIKEIHIDREKNEILIETESGRCFLIYHSQDCCEYVRITNVPDGMVARLTGKVIEGASIDVVFEGGDHRTDSIVCLTCDGNTEVVQWVGESNGYYSESVDFCEIMKRGEA